MNQKIDLTIKQNYLNPFSAPDNPRLNPELLDYLLDRAWYHPKLSLQISCPAEEQERLQQAIDNSFAEKIKHLRGDLMTQRLVAVVLLVLAIALVLSATAMGVEHIIPLGVVTITSWMLVWRTGEILLLDIRSERRELRKYQRIVNAAKHYV